MNYFHSLPQENSLSVDNRNLVLVTYYAPYIATSTKHCFPFLKLAHWLLYPLSSKS